MAPTAEPSQPSDSQRKLAVAGVMLVIFLFAIDATIVSTSMPTIVARLGGLELYSWVFSIYMLTSALTTPVFGKLSDLFSRRRLMLAGIGIFVLGSTLCGLAQSMEMLVASRAIQGLGGGAIYALAFIIVGVLYTPDQRARMQGVISSIWGLSSIFGPLAGGLIVEHANWRWVFFVNLPITAVAIAFIVTGLKEQHSERQKHRLDVLGTATLLIGLMLVFYGLSQSAHSRHPLNAERAALLGSGAAVLVLFYFVERRAAEPVLPLDLFPLRTYRVCSAVAALAAMGVFGAISYLPVHLQGVMGMSPSGAGTVLLLLSLGWTAGSLIAGPSINRFGYRATTAAGMGGMLLGYGAFLAGGGPIRLASVLSIGLLIGTGMGMANLTSLVAAQSIVPIRRIGVATSTIMLFRTFGGAFCISLMGTVLLTQMQGGLAMFEGPNLSPALRDKVANPQNLLEPATRSSIPEDILPRLTALLADSIWFAFLAGFALMAIGFALSFLMPARAPSPQRKPTVN